MFRLFNADLVCNTVSSLCDGHGFDPQIVYRVMFSVCLCGFSLGRPSLPPQSKKMHQSVSPQFLFYSILFKARIIRKGCVSKLCRESMM